MLRWQHVTRCNGSVAGTTGSQTGGVGVQDKPAVGDGVNIVECDALDSEE